VTGASKAASPFEGVEVWFADLAGGAPADAAVLSAGERARAAQLVGDERRRRYAGAHVLVRELLGERLRVAPRDVAIEQDERGKPFVAGREVTFSLAHSASLAAVAIAEGAEIGVDVERLRDIDVGLLAKGTCSEDERARLAEAAEPDRSALFLRLWTAKEAVLKALGVGLTVPPASADVASVLDTGRAACLGTEVASLEPAPGYAGALARVLPAATRPGS
jgi:4'-phosphopantetheinyl transferase